MTAGNLFMRLCTTLKIHDGAPSFKQLAYKNR